MKKFKYPLLVAEMIRHGELQEDLAKVLELSIGSISRRLTGRTRWSIDEANKICEHYGKSYEELFKNND